MVRTELHLKPVLGCGRRIAHCTRIENKEVQPVAVGLELVCRRPDGCERCQVEREKSDVGGRGKVGLDRPDRLSRLALSAGCQVNACRVVFRELEDGLLAETGVPCRDQGG